MSQKEMSRPGSSTTEQAKEQAQHVADQAQDKASKVADEAQVRLREQVDQRSTDLGQQMTVTAKALRSSGNQLSQEGNPAVARAATKAADQAEHFGQYLRTADSDRILADVEQFGRENPWAVIAGGIVAGIVAARFLKASSGRRYDTVYRSPGYESAGYRSPGYTYAGEGPVR
jgi:ElaB/YqjD/DUF883 family membrane-anchored ribosome-binding protein